MKKDTTKQLTSGKPMTLIFNFALTILVGLLFQQLYSMVDTIIVGKTLGVNALAAVGSTSSITFMIVGFCNGVCAGFAIPIAQRFGAEDMSGVRRFTANSIWLAVIFSVVITTVVSLLCRQILQLMNTPSDIIDQAYSYLVIIFIGIPATILYNLTSSIMRSLGDSRTPVYFLIFASCINIVLDLVLILVFGMDVNGAAIATIFSQAISGIGCVIYMIKHYPVLKMNREERRFDKRYALQLVNMGVPMGLQYSITAIGSVILQTAVNSLGSAAVASVAASQKVNMFIQIPFDALGSTMATYGGQNTGALKFDRVREGLKDAITIGVIYSLIILAVMALAGRYVMLLFLDASETAIIQDAVHFLLIQVAFFILLTLVNTVRFLIQGMGFPKFSIFSGVMEMIARTAVALTLVPLFGLTGAALASPFAWALADCFLIPAYRWCYKQVTKKAAVKAF